MYPDPDIDVTASAGSTIVGVPGEDPQLFSTFRPNWTIKFLDRGQRLPAIDVFENAFDWWTAFIYQRGIGA